MRKFLERVGIIDHLVIDLDIEKNEFFRKLRNHVEIGSVKSSFLEPFEKSNQSFKGEVWQSGFKIRRKRRFFDTNYSNAIVTGDVSQKNEKTQVNLEINGFNKVVYFFLGFLLFFFLIFVLMIGFDNFPLLILPLILLQGLFMLGIIFFVMRSQTSKLKRDMEKELYYIIKK